MIIPNIMVSDMARSLAFYRGKIGLDLVMAVAATWTALPDTDAATAVFVILAGHGGQLMLQVASSLREELPQLAATPAFTGTLYLRGFDPRQVLDRLEPGQSVKPIECQWYGMLEAYVRDPDGYVICLGVEDGPPVV